MNLLLVALGAAVGAPLRFLVDRHVVARILHGAKPFPWGTLTVNVLGSFVLGLMTGVTGHTATLLIGVGFCGAFTTYSTFAAETLQLARGGQRTAAALNAALNLGLGLAAAILGATIV
ncbi:fluoride efflux transporter CrcB [Kribbella sp. NPDC051770]|uniref:fluoride efflux transporter CrcB n=1 Tax=Kribbella sp. NPDC051770 TaxID=3155413 RepID=UPI0034262917